MSYISATHPESYSQLLGRSLKLYKATFFRVLLLALCMSVIAFIPRLVSVALKTDIFITLPAHSLHRLWFLLIDLVSLTLFTALLWRIRCVVTNAHEKIRDDLKIAVRKLPLIAIAAVLQTILITAISLSTLGLVMPLIQSQPSVNNLTMMLLDGILFILPTILIVYIIFAFYFYLALILTENQRIISSLKRSAYLVWGNWWRVANLQLTPWLINLLCLLLIKKYLPVNIHLYFVSGAEPSTFLSTLLNIIIFAIFIPWFGATLLVQLRDLELRKKVLPST